MNNEMIYKRELPTLDFIMSEMRQQTAAAAMPENRKIGTVFYLLAASQIFTIFGGAVLGLFIAPATIFASRTQSDEVFGITVGLIGLAAIALGVILIPLSLASAVAFRRDKNWRNSVGFAAAGLAVLAVPFGTILGGYLIWKIIKRKKAERISDFR